MKEWFKGDYVVLQEMLQARAETCAKKTAQSSQTNIVCFTLNIQVYQAFSIDWTFRKDEIYKTALQDLKLLIISNF